MWVANAIAPASVHILCIALRYNKPSGSWIIHTVRFSPSIEQQKHFIIAKSTIWVWCGVAIMNGANHFNHSSVYMHLSPLHFVIWE